jgi:hypothetical protein
MRFPDVLNILTVHSVSELLRSFLSLFRRHAGVLQDVPFFCLLEIPGFLKNSFHNFTASRLPSKKGVASWPSLHDRLIGFSFFLDFNFHNSIFYLWLITLAICCCSLSVK